MGGSKCARSSTSVRPADRSARRDHSYRGWPGSGHPHSSDGRHRPGRGRAARRSRRRSRHMAQGRYSRQARGVADNRRSQQGTRPLAPRSTTGPQGGRGVSHAHRGLDIGRQRQSRRPAATVVHLLSPGVVAGITGHARIAHHLRTHNSRHRPRVHGSRAHHRAADQPRQGQDRQGPYSISSPG